MNKNQPYCPYCELPAKLVGGNVIYPHRNDLCDLMFWQCAPCGAYVGCHKKGAWFYHRGQKHTSDGTLPLGRLADAKLRRAKSDAHAVFDLLWRSGDMSRVAAYAWLSKALGISQDDCHIGMMDVKTCQTVVEKVAEQMFVSPK
jgi:hypothetical protein